VTVALHQPVRTCVGCGQTAARAELVRFKIEGGLVVVDGIRNGGRGAWLHPAATCLDRALGRRAFPRALRSQGARTDEQALRAELTGIARKN
jgi:uncharacterized protein